ncbi:MAG: hypothetical protein ACE1ZA_14265 [Pseudomonadales bacterium]
MDQVLKLAMEKSVRRSPYQLQISDAIGWHPRKNLRRAGIKNEMLRFTDGQQILDFLFRRGEGRKREHLAPYLLLLDIRIPK